MRPLTLLFLIGISSIGKGQRINHRPDFTNVKSIINDQITSVKVPSITIAVVREGKIIWEEGFGFADKENQRLATKHTPYYLASVSKTITATAIMKLAEHNLLNLDSPVNKYLVSGKVSSPKWNPNEATVRTVLSHTAGLTTFNFWCRGDSAGCANRDDVIMSRYAVLMTRPGKYFDYSNLGYGILDHVIRNVSGKSFAQYLDREVFSPLGMKNTYLPLTLREGRAIRYSAFDTSQSC